MQYNEGLVPRTFKELTKLNSKNFNNPILKGQRRHFSLQGKHMVANWYVKRCSSLFIIRVIKNQNKNGISSHNSKIQISKIQKFNQCWWGADQNEIFIDC